MAAEGPGVPPTDFPGMTGPAVLLWRPSPGPQGFTTGRPSGDVKRAMENGPFIVFIVDLPMKDGDFP